MRAGRGSIPRRRLTRKHLLVTSRCGRRRAEPDLPYNVKRAGPSSPALRMGSPSGGWHHCSRIVLCNREAAVLRFCRAEPFPVRASVRQPMLRPSAMRGSAPSRFASRPRPVTPSAIGRGRSSVAAHPLVPVAMSTPKPARAWISASADDGFDSWRPEFPSRKAWSERACQVPGGHCRAPRFPRSR